MKVRSVKPGLVVRVEPPRARPPKLLLPPPPQSTDNAAPTLLLPNIMDMSVSQLWNKMKASVSALHAASMDGQQLRRHSAQTLVRLGAKPKPRDRVPSTILRGMRKKAEQRKKRAAQDAQSNEHVASSEQFARKCVQNAAIYNPRPAEVRKEKAARRRRDRYRKQ